MSIDPRTMTTLLKLQLSPDLSQLTGASNGKAAATGQTSFDQLLSQLSSSEGANWSNSDVDSTSMYGFGIPAQLQLLQGGLPDGLDAIYAQAASPGREEGSPAPYADLIQSAAARYGVSESLIKAVIGTESSFNPAAVSGAGAKGLMQLMDGTASGLGVENSFDPAQNIDGGSKYLSYLLQKYEGSSATALAAYNAGPGRLARLGITSESSLTALFSSLPAETQRYVAKVLDKQKSFSL